MYRYVYLYVDIYTYIYMYIYIYINTNTCRAGNGYTHGDFGAGSVAGNCNVGTLQRTAPSTLQLILQRTPYYTPFAAAQ